MKVINSYNLVRLLLNILFTGLIFWAALDNNSGSEVALGHVLLYNLLLFVPGWVNNFVLLPKLRRDKKTGKYFLAIISTFFAGLLILGQYLHWLQTYYKTDDLSKFTPLGITSSAPGFLQDFQYFFDALPAIIILMIILVIGYVIREFLLKLKKEKHIQNEQTIAELNLLKSQISPHFLFNILNSLYSLSLKKSDETPAVILQLSDILRYSLYETQEREVPILDEVAIIDTYIAIEKIRIPATANVSFNHSGIDNSIKMAPMLLLPLIENAFKHGVDSTVGDSYIHASLAKSENRLVFTCENTFKVSKKSEVGGIGIQNVRKRLNLLYPSRHSFDIEKQENLFKITLKILL
ncbi:sensor histidine kinase [Fluviicola taffensis]|uniref:Signal transduction histidine kinase, LytS n=1 Tax=Fluviicola taffensis (strain DSM 16823 / NCIMB 13979 / RW262) TaxID=755732 RepID=F2IFC4_FLUTR|nr:histidine kinase [Fluviicola taffensis]AEA44609.1 signal transduction histidine kinase, LytS [Fluviicola taffensis DSM 16823]